MWGDVELFKQIPSEIKLRVHPLPQIVFSTYPFSPSLETARGVDRVCFYIERCLKESGLRYELIDGTEIIGRIGVKGAIVRWANLPRLLPAKGRAYLAATPYSGSILATLSRAPLVTLIHDLNPFRTIEKAERSWRASVERASVRARYVMSIRASDSIIVPAKVTRQALIDHFSVDSDRVIVVPYGIDCDRQSLSFTDLPGRETDEDFRVLFMGGSNPIERGGDLIPLIAATVLKSDPGCVFHVSCSPRWHKEMARRISDSNVSEKVSVGGLVPEDHLDQFMKDFDLFLYPSRIGFSLLLLQAMANGLPVVASDCQDLPEFLSDYSEPLPLSEVERFASEILQLKASQSRRRELVIKGKRLVESRPATRMARDIVGAVAALTQ